MRAQVRDRRGDVRLAQGRVAVGVAPLRAAAAAGRALRAGRVARARRAEHLREHVRVLGQREVLAEVHVGAFDPGPRPEARPQVEDVVVRAVAPVVERGDRAREGVAHDGQRVGAPRGVAAAGRALRGGGRRRQQAPAVVRPREVADVRVDAREGHARGAVEPRARREGPGRERRVPRGLAAPRLLAQSRPQGARRGEPVVAAAARRREALHRGRVDALGHDQRAAARRLARRPEAEAVAAAGVVRREARVRRAGRAPRDARERRAPGLGHVRPVDDEERRAAAARTVGRSRGARRAARGRGRAPEADDAVGPRGARRRRRRQRPRPPLRREHDRGQRGDDAIQAQARHGSTARAGALAVACAYVGSPSSLGRSQP